MPIPSAQAPAFTIANMAQMAGVYAPLPSGLAWWGSVDWYSTSAMKTIAPTARIGVIGQLRHAATRPTARPIRMAG